MATKFYRRVRRHPNQASLAQARADLRAERSAHEALRRVVLGQANTYFREAVRYHMDEAARYWTDKVAKMIADKVASLPKVSKVWGPQQAFQSLVFDIELMRTTIPVVRL